VNSPSGAGSSGSYDDKLIKILERLGKRHLPAQLTRLRRAIAV
jgi:hypothetical protein